MFKYASSTPWLKKRLQILKSDYSSKFPYIVSSTLGEHYPHCMTCKTDFTVSSSEMYDITRHVNGPKDSHRSIVKKTGKNAKVTKFSTSEKSMTLLQNNVTTAELRM